MDELQREDTGFRDIMASEEDKKTIRKNKIKAQGVEANINDLLQEIDEAFED